MDGVIEVFCDLRQSVLAQQYRRARAHRAEPPPGPEGADEDRGCDRRGAAD